MSNTTPAFLDDLIQFIQKLDLDNYANLVVVMPSQRAGIILRKKLTEFHTNETLILPEITSIESFIAQVSGIDTIDNTALLFQFYNIYTTTFPNEEKRSFESFIAWGQTLLQDFNEIDRYLVDQKVFFTYLYNINEQKEWLLEEQRTPLIDNYVKFWERLYEYYQELNKQMVKQQKGHQGFQYRQAAARIEDFTEQTHKTFVFAGFNALNNAEQLIFKTMLSQNKAHVFWDADAHFLNDPAHDASLFLKRFKKQWTFTNNGFDHSVHDYFSKPKTIHITGTPKNVSQAKYITQLLAQMTAQELAETALVLADEQLLLVILYSLPPNVSNVNITMGLSLKYTPIFTFFKQFLELHETNRGTGLYCQNLLAFIQNTYAKQIIGNAACQQLQHLIVKNNWSFVTFDLLKEHLSMSKEISALLAPFQTIKILIARLNGICETLKKHTEGLNTHSATYIIKATQQFNEFKALLGQGQFESVASFSVFKQLFLNLLGDASIDFRGNPTQGLQIMGVLESRCLDFKRVILCSVNEGTLPSGKSNTSFIPYDLKIDSKLPTYKEKDAIYAYHFYRLLQRTSQIHLIYNTEVDSLNSGEKSRFIQQLELEPHPNHSYKMGVAGAKIAPPLQEITEVEKCDAILDKLTHLAASGFSPSALSVYLRDPMNFYEKYVLGVGDALEVEEQIAANTLGTVIHNVLEFFYKPLEKKFLQVAHIKDMLLQVENQVAVQFKKEYSNVQIENGVNFVAFQAAIHQVKRFLRAEIQQLEHGDQIEIVAIESKLKTALDLDSFSFPVFISGKVDRVDRLNGQLRIIDYKTGKAEKTNLSIKDWGDLIKDSKKEKALQLLLYAYMFANAFNITEDFRAGIVSFRNLNNGALYFNDNKNEVITRDTFVAFKKALAMLLLEIFDTNTNFIKIDEPTYHT